MASSNLKYASCKLCLKATFVKKFEVIDHLTKTILKNLLPKLEFYNGSKDVMCRNCCKKLNAALEFKSTCLNTDSTIIPYVDSKNIVPVDLRVVYLLENENEQQTSISVDEKVCRLCMQLVKTDYRYIFDEELAAIQKFVPEMIINIIEDPIVCKQCFDSLNTHNDFLNRCSEIDEVIGKTCDISARASETNDASQLDLFIKTESLDNESKINDSKMSLKVEPIDIKSEVEEDSEISLHEDELVDGEISDRYSPNIYGSKGSKPFNLQISECGTSGSKNSPLEHQLKLKGFSEVRVFYKCNTCDYRSKYKGNLKQHQLKHMDISEMPIYICHVCDYKAINEGTLHRHVSAHKYFSEVQVYKYDLRTKSKVSVQLTRKDLPKVPVYKCGSCDYKTKRKCNLKYHHLMHKKFSDVQVYKCDVCHYMTENKSCFRSHRLKHKDIYSLMICRRRSASVTLTPGRWRLPQVPGPVDSAEIPLVEGLQ